MDSERYQHFTDALLARAEAEPDVIGLVATGSMARQGREPDRWSDHDFWLVTEPGAAERYRETQGWLPDASRIVLAFRETAHGVKVVYDDGHLVEYAVFGPEELRVAKANEYRVLLDRERIAERMEAVRGATVRQTPESGWSAGQLLTSLLVAAARGCRGERLSARSLLSSAAAHLARLLAASAPQITGVGGERPESFDDIDPLRRFELAFPPLAAEIDAALAADPEAGALALLGLAERELGTRLEAWPQTAAVAVRRRLEPGRGRPGIGAAVPPEPPLAT